MEVCRSLPLCTENNSVETLEAWQDIVDCKHWKRDAQLGSGTCEGSSKDTQNHPEKKVERDAGEKL